MLRLGLSVAEKVLKIVIAAGKAADGDVTLDDASKLVDAGKSWLGLVDDVTRREPAAAQALKVALAGRIDGMLASPEHRDHARDRASRYEQALERCMPDAKSLRAAMLDANLDAARAGREGAALMLARARDDVPARLAPYLAEGQADAAFFAEVTGAALTLYFGDKAYYETLGRAVQGAVLERLERIEGKLDWLIRKIEAMGLAQPAAESIPRAAVIALARRVAADVEDADQALRELERAVEIAVRVREEGAHGSNLGAFVDDVLRRLAGLTAAGRLDEASREADRAIDDWERAEAARREAAQAAGLKLLEAGLAQDLLRRDAGAAAAKVARRVDLETPGPAARFAALRAAQGEWYVRGRDRGLNLDIEVSAEIARLALGRAADPDQRGAIQDRLGTAMATLGERESGKARLEEAVSAYRAALEDYTRERVPLSWAMTQNNLGNALRTLGERESGTARLEEAVWAYRAALEERRRDRVPLDWAMTQTNLSNALTALGTRESGSARLEESVEANRAALQELTRERDPFLWAVTQNNLGAALRTLGERESGTARLEEAADAYRAALQEWTRERVPLDWATMQNNLGIALATLGERESGTARLEDAVAACRAALEERTRERVPLKWAMTQHNLGNALRILGARETGTTRLEDAVAAYRAALKECTRERVPPHWAMVQHNLGNALRLLGERESGTARLEEAVAAYSAALEELMRERVTLRWATSTGNQGVALMLLAERRADAAMAAQAAAQIEDAHEALREGGPGPLANHYESRLLEARALRDRLAGG